jgi:hypothetical protein
MNVWLRVFGLRDEQPDQTALIHAILAVAPGVSIEWEESDRGWVRAEIRLPRVQETLQVDRFFRDEEGIREELQTWAAWLETADSPHAQALMQHMTSTRQVFTLRLPEKQEQIIGQVCLSVCQFLTRAADGVYQIDDRGFYTADGSLLVEEG